MPRATGNSLGRALLTLGVSAQLGCQAILTAPPESTIVLSANPTFIPANRGVSVLTATVIEPAGTPVPDGTVVQFFTSLGVISEQGKTNDGVARVNLISDSRSGRALVTARSGANESNEIEVAIGSVLPTFVLVTASPGRLTSSRSAQIVANVNDENGNGVPNVPVIFEVIQGTAPSPSPSPGLPGFTEELESGGRPVFTDNSGRAHDVLSTRYPRDLPAKTVTVRATTSNGTTDDVVVVIN
jgi:hypothetical protein